MFKARSRVSNSTQPVHSATLLEIAGIQPLKAVTMDQSGKRQMIAP